MDFPNLGTSTVFISTVGTRLRPFCKINPCFYLFQKSISWVASAEMRWEAKSEYQLKSLIGIRLNSHNHHKANRAFKTDKMVIGQICSRKYLLQNFQCILLKVHKPTVKQSAKTMPSRNVLNSLLGTHIAGELFWACVTFGNVANTQQ